MSWLNHPRFVKIRDSVIDALRRDAYRFRKLKHVVFLCGGHESPRRERVAQYLRARRNDTLLFYAEPVWFAIASAPGADVNALALENTLARLADAVIVIVESPGTFAELGAFSLSDELRKKLLPVLDVVHRGAESFIETGPVRWVDYDSRFSPSVWVNLNAVLEAGEEIDERLNRITEKSKASFAGDDLGSKHLLFFACDLVAIFGPCSADDLGFFLHRILGAQPAVPAATLVQLASAMRLVRALPPQAAVQRFVRPLEDGRLTSFHYTKKYHDIPTLRAQVLSALQGIEDAAVALRQLRTLNAAP